MEKILIGLAVLALGCLLLQREGLMPQRGGGRAGVFLLLLLAAGMRCFLMDRTPSAEEDALREALSWFREAGGFHGIRNYSGSYAVGAQYLLAAGALVRKGSIYLYKGIGFLCDLLLAWGCQRCVRSISGKPRPRLWVFLLVLLLPSGILESSGGMSQSLYALFPVLAASAVLAGRFALGGALLGAALAFDPGMLWVLPVFWIFPAVRENTGRTLLSFAGGYLFLLLPALLFGRSGSLLFPFWPDPGSFFRLERERGVPGLYVLFPTLGRAAGIAVYVVLAGLSLYRLTGRDAWHDRRRQLGGLCFAAAAAAGLLPGMSAGALFGGEALCLALCALEPGMIPAAVCVSAASGAGLLTLFFPELLPFSPLWPAAALFLGLALLLGNVLFRR